MIARRDGAEPVADGERELRERAPLGPSDEHTVDRRALRSGEGKWRRQELQEHDEGGACGDQHRTAASRAVACDTDGRERRKSQRDDDRLPDRASWR